MELSAQIIKQIESDSGQPLRNCDVSQVGGGCISTACRLETDTHRWFVKTTARDCLPMFQAEAKGLVEMAASNTVRVPKVICSGAAGEQAYFVLEYIDLRKLCPAPARLLGQQLAALHQQQQPYFGWHTENTIGSTLQPNQRTEDWLTFWRHQRLEHQLQLALVNGHGGSLQSLGERLLADLDVFFSNYQPVPALLHGDLWSGNAASDPQGKPVIFDPACYYGDREADIAMTELFGGFGDEFLSSYQAAYPLEQGYLTRKTLYNLYHVLNHLNLFGPSYLRQAENMMNQLLAEM